MPCESETFLVAPRYQLGHPVWYLGRSWWVVRQRWSRSQAGTVLAYGLAENQRLESLPVLWAFESELVTEARHAL